MNELPVRHSGQTHTGLVREANEDTLLMVPEFGLFVVLDGMGGHMAGDVASSMARDALHDYVRQYRESQDPQTLIVGALNAGSAAVHAEAARQRDRHGMGTTCVAVLFTAADRALVAHAGDSRAYLCRDRRLQQLTPDHTVVAELIANGAITPEEALHHPYKSVISRNLGSKPQTRVEVREVQLHAGDRLLLCSDGLNGFASHEAIEQIVGGGDNTDAAARELIEVALRGGGGDNVTAVVLEIGSKKVPRSTQIMRTNGAAAWWHRRELFLRAAHDGGLALSPICSVLSPDEALEIVAGNLCEAVFHDLEQTTGINVWTYAQNLASGWFDQDGHYEVLRDLLDVLRGAAREVIRDISAADVTLALQVEMAVMRALVVAEMAVAGLLAERLRSIESAIAEHRAHHQRRRAFTDQPTVPYMQSVKVDPPSPDVAAGLEEALAIARAQLATLRERIGARQALEHAHNAATRMASVDDAVFVARELFAEHESEERGIAPLLDALDQARLVHVAGIKASTALVDVKVAALARAVTAHARLHNAITSIVVEAGRPVSDALQEAAEHTARLRAEVGRGEARLTKLDRQLATRVDVPPDGVGEGEATP